MYTYPSPHPSSPLYARPLIFKAPPPTFPSSTSWFNITTLAELCSHTILQKSPTVSFMGACVMMKAFLRRYACDQGSVCGVCDVLCVWCSVCDVCAVSVKEGVAWLQWVHLTPYIQKAGTDVITHNVVCTQSHTEVVEVVGCKKCKD